MFDRLLDRMPDIRRGRRGPAPPVELHQRDQAPARGVRAVVADRPLAGARSSARTRVCPRRPGAATAEVPDALPPIPHLPPHGPDRPSRRRLRHDGVRRRLPLGPPLQPRATLASRYTYSERPDGAPGWEKETPWPDPMCTIGALSTVTSTLTFTTGVYIAPVRDLITVAKSVGTAAALSEQPRSPRGRCRLVPGGVRADGAGLREHGASTAQRDDPRRSGRSGRAVGSSSTARSTTSRHVR